MAMPSALIGFAYFKGLRTLMCRLGEPMKRWGWGEEFSEVENVLVQTVAGSVGTMPLGCGFVGVVPALEFLLKKSETPESSSRDPEIVLALEAAKEGGGLRLPLGKLVLWALGLCFFGVVFAVPLRKQVIVREKLRFPSGTATALMIGVLHGGEKTGAEGNIEEHWARQRKGRRIASNDEERRLMGEMSPDAAQDSGHASDGEDDNKNMRMKKDWKKQIRLLMYSFGVSGAYVRRLIYCHEYFFTHCNVYQLLTAAYTDSHIIFCSSTSLHPNTGLTSLHSLALELEPITSICRSRHHNGSRDNNSYVCRSCTWVGRPESLSQVQRLGLWRRRRLEHRLQGLDRLDITRYHACGCHY